MSKTTKNQSTQKPRRKTGHIFWGVLFLLAAAAVAISVFTPISLGGIAIGWLILNFFLAGVAIFSLIKRNWFSVFLPIAGILTITSATTDFLTFTGGGIGAIWIIAVLLSIGLSIIFRSTGQFVTFGVNLGNNSAETSATDESELAVAVNFGTAIKHINSDNFQQAVLSCNFGEITAHFDNAKIKSDRATITISSNFSDIELFIPKSWVISNEINCTLSDLAEKGTTDPSASKTIVITGSAVFSDITIIRV